MPEICQPVNQMALKVRENVTHLQDDYRALLGLTALEQLLDVTEEFEYFPGELLDWLRPLEVATKGDIKNGWIVLGDF